jgi:Glycosyl transferases group 1
MMRLFQNIGLTEGYRKYFGHLPPQPDFSRSIAQFLDTRYGASHILAPVLSGASEAFCTNGDDERLQTLWARKRGLRTDSLEQILLAQIEHHRTEVFYNLDPMRYGSAFVRKLPGCVKKTICWRAAPSGEADLTNYDLVVCNFPSILQDWQRQGCNVAYFFPAHDPAMDHYAGARRDDIDLVFIGSFSRHHNKRSAALRAAASVPGVRACFHLEDSRLTKLAHFLPFVPGLGSYRHPREIRIISAGPLYGRDAYAAMAGARIVFNGAIDMAGEDRGNMRCFEATGCGAVLLTDSGRYPEGFVDSETMVTYSSVDQIPKLIERLVADASWANSIAEAGCAMVRDRYSKERQWAKFQELA